MDPLKDIPHPAGTEPELPAGLDSSISQSAVSAALATIFRGKFCDAILPGRRATTFKPKEVIYEVGDQERTFFFLQDGFVKLGTIRVTQVIDSPLRL